MSMLPETSAKPALIPLWFPTPWQAVLWRNWGLVPIGRLAKVLKATEEQLRAAAGDMGLDPALNAKPEWLARGYVTIVRSNWQLCSFKQITELLGITEDSFAVMLKEEDFLWHKLGKIKPTSPDISYTPLTEEQKQTTARIKKIVEAVPAELREENAYSFMKRYSAPVTGEIEPRPESDGVNIIYSFFALYGDPLANPELDPFPDALLAEYAATGVKGVWMQGILYQLTEFPFDPSKSEGWQTRQESLRRLVARAKKFGIGIYLYFNEPRSMDDAFFQKWPQLRGEREGDFYALCTSTPEVKKYIEDAAYNLFSAVPDLAGFFTITMSENLTNCYSRAGETVHCERCAKRNPWEVVAEVNNLLARGAHRANPKARAIAWSWGWRDEWATKVPALLTEGQIVQCNSEERLPTNVGGVPGYVSDYSISQVGPGEKAKSVWKAALDAGLQTCAKVQVNTSWEASAIPFLPTFDKVAEHVRNLKKAGVRNLQLSWTLGGCPSPVLKMVDRMMSEGGDAESFLKDWLGDELGAVMNKAQALMSSAFGEFPFACGVLYRAPQNYGPMIPIYTEPTGWESTMVTFPYDDLDGWRIQYPRDVFLNQFEKLTAGWSKGVELMEPMVGKSERFDELYNMAMSALCHFRTSRNLVKFVIHRDAWLEKHEESDREAMLWLIQDERVNTETLIRIRHADDRIGFEATNHYCYTVNDLVEKLVNLDYCERKLQR